MLDISKDFFYFTAYFLLHGLLTWRIWLYLETRISRFVLLAVMGCGYLLMALQLGLIGGLWQGLVLIAGMLIPMEWLLRRVIPVGWRPILLKGMLLATLAGTVTGYFNGLALPIVSHEQVCLSEWTGRKPLKLIHVSDLHLNENDTLRLGRVVKRIQTLQPDLILFTGDILVGVGWPQDLARGFRELKAPFGVYAVRGNHEIRKGGEKAFREFCVEAGISPLVNEHVDINGLILAGVDEINLMKKKQKASWNLPGGDLNQTLNNIPGNRPILLLAHRGSWAYQAEKAGVDLMLCGHTHGGQLPPLSWLVSVLDPFSKGDYQVGSMQLKVSSGAGVWHYLPIRLFSRNLIHEILVSGISEQ